MPTLANNITLSTDLNQAPYWDDFDEEKSFYRILFKPSMAVQARELTQIQSILQNQVDRFASHIFQEGSRVKGGEFNYDQKYYYVKVDDTNPFGNTVFVDNFANTELTGETSGVKAIVIDVADGTAAAANTKTLFVKYTSAGSNNTSQTFLPGETLTANNGFTAAILAANNAVGTGSAFTIGEGIIYARDHMVYHPQQTIVLDRYSTTPSYRVGFEINEEIVNYLQDSSLLDPAGGAPNFAAPGADRLRLTATLAKLDYEANVPEGFVELITIKDGVVQEKAERPRYADIRDELARRTYDESGDYVVRGFGVRVREHLDDGENGGLYPISDGGNTSLLAVGVEPGVGYVKGYDYETLVTTWLDTDKGIDYKDVEGVSIAANYGSYLIVKEMVGFWDVSVGAQISLWDTADERLTDRKGSTTSPAGNLLGTANVRAVVHESGDIGTSDCQWRIYIFNVRLTTGTLSDVKAIYLNNSSGTDAGADVVQVGDTTQVYEPTFRSLVYPIPASYVRTIRDPNGSMDMVFQWYAKFTPTIAADGTFTLTSDVDETFPYSTGALNATQKRTGFIVALDDAVATANLEGTIEVSDANVAVIGSGTSFDSRWRVGDYIKVGSDIRRVVEVSNSTYMEVDEAFSSASSGLDYQKYYLAGHILDFTTNGAEAGEARTVTVNSSTSVTFDMKETLEDSVTCKVIANLNKIDSLEKKKIIRRSRYVQINLNTHAAGTDGPWCIGFADVYRLVSVRKNSSAFTSATQGTDVTSGFRLDNGQRDGSYELAYLVKDGASITNTDYLLIEVDFFSHDTSLGDGFLSIDSYPIDDINGAANTSAITTKEIPLFISPTTGFTYDLRDCIDCRPRRQDTATNTTVVASATVNPSATSNFQTSTNGLMTPVVNEDFIFDLSYYLPRKDLVVIDSMGNMKVVRGVPNRNPITPRTPDNAMAIAVLEIPPYPSLPSSVGNEIGRSDLAVKIKRVAYRRYTMRDIGVLDKRITNMEYYQALSLLEKETADMMIPDDQGLNRFKNGILVDPFQGSKIANVYHPDYAAAIDPKANEMRPRASINHIAMELASTSNIYRNAADVTIILSGSASSFIEGENVYQGDSYGSASATGYLRHAVDNRLYVEQVTGTFVAGIDTKGQTSSASVGTTEVRTPTPGNLAVLPYHHEIYSTQPFATGTRNASGLIYNWKGFLQLVPDIDTWTDTTTLPDVTVNFDGNLDAWQTLVEAWGTEWDSWTTRWTGQQVINEQRVVEQRRTETTRSGDRETTTTFEDFRVEQTVRTSQHQTRTGEQMIVVPETVTQSLGSSVVDVTVIPYMRARRILMRAVGLKPNARVFAFFDGEAVSEYCTPISSQAWDYFQNWGAVVGLSGTKQGPVILSDITNYNTAAPPTQSAHTVGEVLLQAPNWYNPNWVGEQGDALITDSEGKLLAFFDLPNNASKRFPVGSRMFRLTDSITNSSAQGQTTTSAEALYTAQGVHQHVQETIVSTQQAKIETIHVEETRVVENLSTNVTRGTRIIGQTTRIIGRTTHIILPPGDPIAQSVLIRVNDNLTPGLFVTKLDVYFQTKHSYLPIIVQLRELVDGSVTGGKIVPYSEVVIYPEDIHISEDGTAPTVIQFPAPVFLQHGEDYAFVLRPAADNPDYAVYIAQIGQTDLATGERVIMTPATGTLFASSNDRTWSPIQDEDIKYTLYRAHFDTDVRGTIVLQNERREYLTITDATGNFDTMFEQVRGPLTITANTVSGTVNTGEYVWGGTSNAYGAISGISNNVFIVEELEAGRTFQAGESLVFTFSNSTPTGATANLQAISLPVGFVAHWQDGSQNTSLHLVNVSSVGFSENDKIRGMTSNTTAIVEGNYGIKANLVKGHASQLVFAETDIDWEVKSTSNGSPPALASAWEIMQINENHEFDREQIILSASDEDDYLGGDRSLQFRATLESTNPYISPVVDLTVMGAIVVHNIINNDATGEDGARGGNALARYITRKVTLKEDEDAEDLKVFLTMYQPAGTGVRVYAKYLHSEDSDLFDDREWVEMVRTGSSYSDSQNKQDFREAEFNLPDSVKTGENGEVEYENSLGVTFTGYRYFAIKIVLLSPNTSLVPRIKNLRAIALQL